MVERVLYYIFSEHMFFPTVDIFKVFSTQINFLVLFFEYITIQYIRLFKEYYSLSFISIIFFSLLYLFKYVCTLIISSLYSIPIVLLSVVFIHLLTFLIHLLFNYTALVFSVYFHRSLVLFFTTLWFHPFIFDPPLN